MKLNLDLDDMTNAGLKRLVKQLLAADEEKEKKLLAKAQKNDLADLDEEMHGKPNTPQVEDDDLPGDGELADVPKTKKRS
jgi:hypothetical protein